MLQQVRAANPEAGVQFLEHLVLQKRSTVRAIDRSSFVPVADAWSNKDRTLHTELAIICVDQLLAYLGDEAVSKLWRAKGLPVMLLVPATTRSRLFEYSCVLRLYTLL
jgi:vacuolar protein sorting-associated protein 3